MESARKSELRDVPGAFLHLAEALGSGARSCLCLVCSYPSSKARTQSMFSMLPLILELRHGSWKERPTEPPETTKALGLAQSNLHSVTMSTYV